MSDATQKHIRASKCVLSAGSIWEIALKCRLGKLTNSPRQIIQAAQQSEISMLPISPEHACTTHELPMLHADSFDRILIAQARVGRLVLSTADAELLDYVDHIALAV